MKETKQQELRGEEEMQSYVAQGPENEQKELHTLSEQSMEQRNTQADPELSSEIAKKREIEPQEGLREASVRQKQTYLNHLGQYRQARKNWLSLRKGKNLKH